MRPSSTRRRHQRGYTLVELTVALALGLVVVLALGQLILANLASWELGRDKIVLQQNETEALEWMARWIRAARTITVIDTTAFETYDENGNLVHTFELANVGGENRLHQDGADLVDRRVTRFRVDTDDDTTSVTLTLELEDEAGSRVGAVSRTAVRNRSFEF